MQLGFWRGRGDPLNWLIRVWTGGPYSHCELVFSDGEGFSASGRRKPAVQFYRESLGDRWDFVGIPCTPTQEELVREHARRYAHLAADFDWRGVCSFVLPSLGSSPGKWYCTSLIIHCLHQANILNTVPLKVSPNELSRILLQNRVTSLADDRGRRAHAQSQNGN